MAGRVPAIGVLGVRHVVNPTTTGRQHRPVSCRVGGKTRVFRAPPVGTASARDGMCVRREASILEVTQNAVAAIRRVVAAAADSDIRGIRIAVAGGGCSGAQYEMGLEADAREGDAVIHIDGVMIFVGEESKSALAGVEVDFCQSPAAEGFIFHRPGGCGSCGKRQSCGV